MIHWHIRTISDLNNISPVLKFVFPDIPFSVSFEYAHFKSFALDYLRSIHHSPYSSLIIPILFHFCQVLFFSSGVLVFPTQSYLILKTLPTNLNIHTSIEASYYLLFHPTQRLSVYPRL